MSNLDWFSCLGLSVVNHCFIYLYIVYMCNILSFVQEKVIGMFIKCLKLQLLIFIRIN